MNIILIMIASTAIFFIGIQVGYNLKEKTKIIDRPKIEDIKKNIPFAKEYKEDKENKEEITRLNKIMSNLDNFNGTKEGQVDVD